MKRVLLTVITFFAMASIAPAAPVDTSNLDAIIAEAQGVKADNRRLEDGLADANVKIGSIDAAWTKTLNVEKANGKKALKDQADAYDVTVAGLRKDLRKYDHWYVRAVIACARAIKWIIGSYVVICLLVIGFSWLNPIGVPYQIGQFFVRMLPLMNWTRIFSPRTVPTTVASIVTAPVTL